MKLVIVRGTVSIESSVTYLAEHQICIPGSRAQYLPKFWLFLNIADLFHEFILLQLVKKNANVVLEVCRDFKLNFKFFQQFLY